MNRYWDLTEQERAKLTSEQIDALLVVELMEKGVVRVEKPELQPVEEVKPKTERFYGIQVDGEYSSPDQLDICFQSIETAEQFSRMAIMRIKAPYPSYTKHVAYVSGLTIVPLDLPSAAEVVNVKAELEKAAAAKKANADAMTKYNADSKAVDDAVKGVWDDWQACRGKARDAGKVKTTLAEYLGLCDGNRETAEKFLAKAFDEDRIAEAKEWFGSEWNIQDMADELPA